MSCVDLLASSVWSEADILAHGREVINSVVPVARQDELRTILLGHLAQMRAATQEEMQEIMLVQLTTEAQVLDNNEARADMAILNEALSVERGELPIGEISAGAQELYALRHPEVEV